MNSLRRISGFFTPAPKTPSYAPLSDRDDHMSYANGSKVQNTAKASKPVRPRYPQRLPFRQIFTYNVVCTLITQFLISFSAGIFNVIFYSYLSSDVLDPQNAIEGLQSPLEFSGGVGLSPTEVGLVLTILGGVGICLQILLYPTVNDRIGTIRAWRIFLYCFPVALALCPFLSLVPSTSPPPSGKTGVKIWLAIGFVISLWTTGRTFVNPGTTILMNNCSPHPSVLGTIHGIGQSANSAAKTIGPALGGWLYGFGLSHNIVGLAFWVLAIMSCCTITASNWVREGNGHEIRLEGDDEAEEEAEAENRALGLR